MPPDKIENLLNDETSRVLHEMDIHAIHDCWADQDTADPNYLGHAKAAMEFSPLASASAMEAWEQERSIAYADFVGILDMARLSISLTNLHAEEHRQQMLLGGNKYFALHRMGAIIHLDIASDRLRTFLIAAIFRQTIDEYQQGSFGNNKRKWYCTPFLEAASKPEAAQPLSSKITTVAEQIFQYRKTRHSIIHEIATDYGKTEKMRCNGELKNAVVEYPTTWEEIDRTTKQAIEKYNNGVSKALDDLREWYKLLIGFSNDIFLVAAGNPTTNSISA